jgi:hypothetical protein
MRLIHRPSDSLSTTVPLSLSPSRTVGESGRKDEMATTLSTVSTAVDKRGGEREGAAHHPTQHGNNTHIDTTHNHTTTTLITPPRHPSHTHTNPHIGKSSSSFFHHAHLTLLPRLPPLPYHSRPHLLPFMALIGLCSTSSSSTPSH